MAAAPDEDVSDEGPAGEDAAPMHIDQVDRILESLDWGSIAFNSSTTMEFGKPQMVELLLSPTLSTDDLQKKLHQQLGADSARVRVSQRMQAELKGTGFTIETETPSIQAISHLEVTHWNWEVVPKAQGTQYLHLSLSTFIELAGQETPLVIRTFDREIRVDVTLGQRLGGFVKGNWQWLWATIVVPVATYLWARRRQAKPPQGGRPVNPM